MGFGPQWGQQRPRIAMGFSAGFGAYGATLGGGQQCWPHSAAGFGAVQSRGAAPWGWEPCCPIALWGGRASVSPQRGAVGLQLWGRGALWGAGRSAGPRRGEGVHS